MADTNQNAKLFSELFGKNTNIIVGSIGSQTAAGTIAQIQTAAGAIAANTLRDMSPGVALLFQASNGLWYCVNADQRATDVISSEVIYKRSTQIVAEPPPIAGKVKVLYFIHEGGNINFYIGGDRETPSKIHGIPATMSTPHGTYLPDIYGFINSTGVAKDEWIVQLKYSYCQIQVSTDLGTNVASRSAFPAQVPSRQYMSPHPIPPELLIARIPASGPWGTGRVDHAYILDKPFGVVPRVGDRFVESGNQFDENSRFDNPLFTIKGYLTFCEPEIEDKFPRSYAVTLISKQKWELNGENAEAIVPVGYGFWNATNDVIFPSLANDTTYETTMFTPPADDTTGRFDNLILIAEKLEDKNDDRIFRYDYSKVPGFVTVNGITSSIYPGGGNTVLFDEIDWLDSGGGFGWRSYSQIHLIGRKFQIKRNPAYNNGLSFARANETGSGGSFSGYGYIIYDGGLFPKSVTFNTVFPTFLNAEVVSHRSPTDRIYPESFGQTEVPFRASLGGGQNAAISWYKGSFKMQSGSWQMDWKGTKPNFFSPVYNNAYERQYGQGNATINAPFTLFPGVFKDKGIEYKYLYKDNDIAFNAETLTHSLLYVNHDLSNALVRKQESKEYFGEGWGAFKFIPPAFIRINGSASSRSTSRSTSRAFDGAFWDWQIVLPMKNIFAYLHYYSSVIGVFNENGPFPFVEPYENWRSKVVPNWFFSMPSNKQERMMGLCITGRDNQTGAYFTQSTPPENITDSTVTLQLYSKDKVSEPTAVTAGDFPGFVPSDVCKYRRFVSYVGKKLYCVNLATSATLPSSYIPWTTHIEAHSPYKKGDRIALVLDTEFETNHIYPGPAGTKQKERIKYNRNTQTGELDEVRTLTYGSSLSITYASANGGNKTENTVAQEERINKALLFECFQNTDLPPSTAGGGASWRAVALPDITKQEQMISVSQYEIVGGEWKKKDSITARILPLKNLTPEMSVIDSGTPSRLSPYAGQSGRASRGNAVSAFSSVYQSTDFARAAGRHNILSASYYPGNS
jgi:hypothetical protein